MRKRNTFKPKYIIDPEWLKENRSVIYNKISNFDDPNEFLPDNWYEEAQWVMVLHSPETAIKVPKFSLWIAMPDESSEVIKYNIPKKYWKIFTPYGELRLHLREAKVVDITKYVEFLDKDCFIKFISDNPQISDQVIKDRLFYIRSRGIGKAEALKYVLGDLKDPQLFYIVFRKEYQQMYCREWEFVGDDVEYQEIESIGIDRKKLDKTTGYYL